MKQRAFTLIELLVVVALIGILAAVGVVAYNGYTKSAKESAVRNNFKSVVKYINNELMKCELGELKIMGGALNCPKGNTFGTGIVSNIASVFKTGDNIFRNPYDNGLQVNTGNIYNREEFRQKSLISNVANGVICGFGAEGYVMALDAMKKYIK